MRFCLSTGTARIALAAEDWSNLFGMHGTVCGGNFFYFHPVELLDGTYFNEDDPHNNMTQNNS